MLNGKSLFANTISAVPTRRTALLATKLLAVLGALFLAAALFGGTPVQAQTEVWSGTLTVRDSAGVLGCTNSFQGNFCTTHLSDDDFTHDSTDYAIKLIFLRTTGGRLEIAFDTDLTTATQALTLNVAGTAFAFEDADIKMARSRQWNNTGLSWTAGNTVSLTLTGATTSGVTLVSNANQGTAEKTGGNRDRAQSFTTGTNPGGYTLGSVEIVSADTQDDDATVAVYTVNSSGYPDTLHASLTAPASFAQGTLVFSDPMNTPLDGGTTYTLLIVSPGGETLDLNATTDDGEDSGGAAGWTIADAYHYKTAANVWQTTNSGKSFRITIKGTAVGATTLSTDATLSDLTLSHGTLDPSFASATTSYTATVANTVAQITVTPTKSDNDATVEYLDASDGGLTDADSVTPGHQVALLPRENTFKVKVTAADTTTTETYTVVVTRTEPAKTHCDGTELWCESLTVGHAQGVGISFHGWTDSGIVVGTKLAGSITDDNQTFVYSGQTYDLQSILITNTAGNPLGVTFNSGGAGDIATEATRSKLDLRVDGEPFNLGSGTYNSGSRRIDFTSPGFTWTAGQTVALKITEAASAPVAPMQIPTAPADTSVVLVKNTGKTARLPSPGFTSATGTKKAQEFTTGPNQYGYTLDSIGVQFTQTGSTSDIANKLTVTLNAAGASQTSVGDALCTLTHPSSYRTIAKFKVPGTCPVLLRSTSYFVVFTSNGLAATDLKFGITTSANGMDSGSLDGWENDGSFVFFRSGTWTLEALSTIRTIVEGRPMQPAPVRFVSPGTPVDLVKNTGQPGLGAPRFFLPGDDANYPDGRSRIALEFTTGPHQLGYAPDSVTVAFGDLHSGSGISSQVASKLTVSINAAGAGLDPGDALCTLSHPSSYKEGTNKFAVPRTCQILLPSTRYFVVLTSDGLGATVLAFSSTGSNEDSGSADGWSINNKYRAYEGTSWEAGLGSLRLGVGGWAVPLRPTSRILWSATLTAKDHDSITGATGWSVGVSSYPGASLSDEDFVVGSTTYSFKLIDEKSGTLFFAITPILQTSVTNRWDLDVDGTRFSFSGISRQLNTARTEVQFTKTSSGLSWDDGDSVSLSIVEALNVDASGLSITGDPVAGNTLTADTSGITDPNGVPADVTYTYQWARSDRGADTDISGATASTYQLKPRDAGKTVKLKVTFTDSDGFTESLTSEVQVAAAPDVHVGNLGESDDDDAELSNSVRVRAQAFTAGAGVVPDGKVFRLKSIKVDFADIADTAGAGGRLRVTLNEADGSNPGPALCTLNDPATFSANNVNVFTAPDGCPGLRKNTTYYVVAERTDSSGGDIKLNFTNSDSEDPASPGWSVADTSRHYAASMWSSPSPSSALMIEVEAREPALVWSGTMTVGSNQAITPTYGYSSTVAVPYGTLAPNSFTDGSSSYTVTQITAGSSFDVLILGFDTLPPQSTYGSWTLLVDGTTSFDLLQPDSASTTGVGWQTFDITWPVNQKVNLAIVETNSAATGTPGIGGTAQEGMSLAVEGSDILWSSTMTVGEHALSGGFGYSLDGFLSGGALDSTTFTVEATTYAITRVHVNLDANNKPLRLLVSPAADASHLSGLVLMVDGTYEIPLDGPYYQGSEFRLVANNTTLNWIAGQTVDLELKGGRAVSGITDANGLAAAEYSYQWLADGVAIPGAEAPRYWPAAGVVGQRLSIRVGIIDDRGYEATLTSAQTDAVDDSTTVDVIWSAAMTAGATAGGSIGFDPGSIPDTGKLSPPAFTFAGDSYTVDGLLKLSGSGSLGLSLGTTFPVRFSLVYGEIGRVESGDANVAFAGNTFYTWAADPGWSEGDKVALAMIVPINVPLTGAPVISGQYQEGATLTADVTAIQDDNGLENASFTYKWERVDCDTASDNGPIPMATSQTLIVVAGDLDCALQVTVTHTDGDGYVEEAVSSPRLAIGITLSAPSLTVAEGGTATYMVALAAQPTADVTITITIDGDGDNDNDVTVDDTSTSLTFTDIDWETPQTVTVSAAEDDDSVNDTETMTHTVDADSAAEYLGITLVSLPVTVDDNDDAGATVFRTELTVRENSTVSYTVVLDAQPTANVTIDIGGAGSDVTVSPTSLTFTTDNWDDPQTVTVTGKDDPDAADGSATLTHTVAAGSAAEYLEATVTIASVAVTVTDDDEPKLVLSTPSLAVPLEVPEGGSANYDVSLATLPTSSVTVNIIRSSSDVSINKTTLTFTTGNWSATQTVTVSAVQDADSIRERVTLTHAAVQSGGGMEYNNKSANLPVVVNDDDISSDATLHSLVLNGMGLDTPFHPSTINYTARARYDFASVRVRVTFHPEATVYINGWGYAPHEIPERNKGTFASILSLGEGSTKITIGVNAQDGETKMTYTVTVDRASLLPAPRSFRAAAESSNGIAVSWYSLQGAAEYRLEYRKDGETGNWTRINLGDFDHRPSTTNNRTLLGVATGLDCNTAYDFRLSARGDGDSAASTFGPYAGLDAVRTDACAQENEFTNLRVTMEPNCATLTWTNPTDPAVTGYELSRGSVPGGTIVVLELNLRTSTTRYRDCSDEYQTEGAMHSYHLKALPDVDSAQTSLNFYGPGSEPPMPRNGRFTHKSVSRRSLAWEAPPSHKLTFEKAFRGETRGPVADPWITGYQVERREYVPERHPVEYEGDQPTTEDGWEILQSGDAGRTATSFTDSEHKGTKSYVYRVRTVNSHGPSSRVEEWLWNNPHATVPEENTPPPQENSPATGAPTISGAVRVGETLTADASGIADTDGLNDASFAYQWLADDSEVAGATDSTYTLTGDDLGKAVKVRVTFTDDAGNEESLTSAETDAVEARPNSPATGAPTISGTVQVGETLTAQTSGIADEDGLDNASFAYQWMADDTEVAGATDSTYTLTDDEGKAVKVRVTFTDDAGNEESLTSAETGAVEPRPNSPATGQPAITGTAQVGETLTAETSGIADTDGLENAAFAYQWLADDSEIAAATDSTYTLTDDDEGKAVKVRVTFTDDAGNEESLTSAGKTVDVSESVDESESHDRPYDLQATAVEGAITLTWQDPDTHPLHDLYEILRRRPELGEAKLLVYAEYVEITDRTFTDSDVEPGVLYEYAVKAVKDYFGYLGPASDPVELRVPTGESGETPKVNSPATGQPTISGTAQVDETLTAGTAGIADEDGLVNATFSYQWVASDGNADADIEGETGSTYELSDDDVGKAIKVRVGFTDDEGNGESLTSAATNAVAAAPNRAATGSPTISGTPQVGETLTADTANIADEDGLTGVSYRYQWIAGGADIDGATSSSYTLTSSEQGQTIQVKVSFTNDRNNAETLTSVATDAVAAKPTPLTASFSNVPDSHDGSNTFTFALAFSENFPLSYVTLRDHAFTVSGGDVKKAQRKTKGSNRNWTITVQPDSNGAVSITLPETTDCYATGAICTGDGRKLSNRNEFTVSGPGQ